MEDITLNLPDGRRVSYGHGDIASIDGGGVDGLIVEGSLGFNDLGGYFGSVISPLLGADTASVKRLCDDNTHHNEDVTLIAVRSTRAESVLRAAVLVPTELGLPYQRLAAPNFGKPHRDFYYNVAYEAFAMLAEYGCTGIAVAGLRGYPRHHKDIGNCVAEALLHFAMRDQSLRRVVTVASGPDLSEGIRFFNEHAESIAKHREIDRRSWTEGHVTRLTIDLPPRRVPSI